MLPGIGPGAVTERIADTIIGDGCAVISRQQILLISISIKIGVPIGKGTHSSCSRQQRRLKPSLLRLENCWYDRYGRMSCIGSSISIFLLSF